MALEPITRQEKIIAGQDLTPITRMEKFLKQYGGGSGGVTSWNDLTDKPFGTSVEFGEIVPSQSVTTSEYYGMCMTSSFPPVGAPIIVGETYAVTWDGTEYNCVAFDMSGQSAIGNLAIVGQGDDTGEPFLVAASESKGMTITKSAGTYTASIKGAVEVNHPIDSKYMPEPLIIDAENLPNSTATWRELCLKLEEANETRRDVFLSTESDGPCKCITNNPNYNYFIGNGSRYGVLKIFFLESLYGDGGQLKEYTLTLTEA